MTQAEVDAAFANWVAATDATFSGGCNASMSNNAPAAPDFCGGTVSVTWTVVDDCAANVISKASGVFARGQVVLNWQHHQFVVNANCKVSRAGGSDNTGAAQEPCHRGLTLVFREVGNS